MVPEKCQKVTYYLNGSFCRILKVFYITKVRFLKRQLNGMPTEQFQFTYIKF